MEHKSQRTAALLENLCRYQATGEPFTHGKHHHGRLEKKLHDLETSSFTQYIKKKNSKLSHLQKKKKGNRVLRN
jgi:hypothetical protein